MVAAHAAPKPDGLVFVVQNHFRVARNSPISASPLNQVPQADLLGLNAPDVHFVLVYRHSARNSSFERRKRQPDP